MIITYEDDRVVINSQGDEDRAVGLILDVTHNGESPITDEFLYRFKIHGHEYLVNEDTYQGLNVMRVFERKSDKVLFGYQYWNDISKHGEAYVEPNGDMFDLEPVWSSETDEYTDGPFFVLLPVKPITFIGYEYV